VRKNVRSWPGTVLSSVFQCSSIGWAIRPSERSSSTSASGVLAGVLDAQARGGDRLGAVVLGRRAQLLAEPRLDAALADLAQVAFTRPEGELVQRRPCIEFEGHRRSPRFFALS
jgi:hypothetical protein